MFARVIASVLCLSVMTAAHSTQPLAFERSRSGRTNASSETKDPMLGSWKLNVAKSRWSTGTGPKSQIRTYQSRDGGILIITIDTVNADDTHGYSVIAAKYDGREYPIVASGGNSAAPTMISYRRVDASTVEYTNTIETRVVSTASKSVSADGKTMTHRVKGTNPQGQAFSNVLVFDRQ